MHRYAEIAAQLAEVEAQDLEKRATKLRMFAVMARTGQATFQRTSDAVYVRVVTQGGRDWMRRVEAKQT